MNTCKVVSDLICPWCYIGKRRLEIAARELMAGTAACVSWHPFQLNPEMPSQGMDRKEYCTRKFGSWERCQMMYAKISEAGKAVGIEFRFDLQPRIPNSFDAHRMIWLAGQQDVQNAVVEALFRAYFCEGVNLSMKSNLVEVAASAGLEETQAWRLLNSDEGVAEVEREEQEIKTFGVSAVPLFIFRDRLAVSGAQPPEHLLKAFVQAQELERKAKQSRRRKANPQYVREGYKV